MLVGGRDAPFSVIVSDHAWSHLFDRDPRIVGTTIRIAELQATVTIAGVAPAALDLPKGTDLWFNLRTDPQGVAHNFVTIARMRPGVAVEQLRATAAVAMAGLARTIPSDVGREYVIRSLLSSLVGDLGPTLLIVLGATALLLVLACVNVTNLLLARGMTPDARGDRTRSAGRRSRSGHASAADGIDGARDGRRLAGSDCSLLMLRSGCSLSSARRSCRAWSMSRSISACWPSRWSSCSSPG